MLIQFRILFGMLQHVRTWTYHRHSFHHSKLWQFINVVLRINALFWSPALYLQGACMLCLLPASSLNLTLQKSLLSPCSVCLKHGTGGPSCLSDGERPGNRHSPVISFRLLCLTSWRLLAIKRICRSDRAFGTGENWSPFCKDLAGSETFSALLRRFALCRL
jgi:hypothetical protein